MPKKRSYRYNVVDVFTQVPLEGNPLAVFPHSEGLDGATMQRVARELNLSETVFMETAGRQDCVKRFRIFTPSREMTFAGHPTIGASYVLLTEGMISNDTERFSIEEKIGPVAVSLEQGNPLLLWLETPTIRFETKFDTTLCARALRVDPGDLIDIAPQILDAGNPTLFVALRDRDAVDRASLDVELFSKLKTPHQEPFCMFVFTPVDHGAYSRMFAPDYGILEDPATGSSTGPLGAFMRLHGLLPRNRAGRFSSEQGTKMGRRSLLHFEILESESQLRVMVGGHVTPLVDAVMTL